jgi:hypothetical protein
MLASLIFNQKMRKRIAAIAIVNRVEIDILSYYLEYLGRKKQKMSQNIPVSVQNGVKPVTRNRQSGCFSFFFQKRRFKSG